MDGPFSHRQRRHAAMQSASLARGNSRLHTAAATCPSTALRPRNLSEFRQQWRNGGPACVLGVGTANPGNCIQQDDYTDWYFRITKSDHLTHTKAIMKKMCEKMKVKKRYLQVNEELFHEHPEFLDPAAPTLPGKLAVVANVMPGLVAAAAEKAIAEWGRLAGDITHLVFATSTSAQLPHIDLRIASLLGLNATVQRTAICFHGCSGSSAGLRIVKDIAENNRGARVLVACADMWSVMDGYAAVPDAAQERYGIIGRALFGDGAGAVVVGADPRAGVERPIFEMVSASQATLPGSDRAVAAELTKDGMEYRLEFGELAAQVGGNIERCLVDAVSPPLGIGGVGWNWNSLFWGRHCWVVHPGGPAIMDSFKEALGLEPAKLAASRRVLSEYGNMTGPTTIFVLDEVTRRGQRNHEEGSCEWGLMVGFGPGFTIEVMALHACNGKSVRHQD
ncbi:bisdemethoxycurcumin synthase-like [Miscanthus floridulus]|uniref:bisdemethoxycurcumin synthase-like n=1 Tax=Miscanthus floridulus TaxID=154761 RepID=UPI00345975B9